MKTKRRDDRIIAKELNVQSKFEIAGVEVTATAAELNAIAGGGLSAAELGYLDGVTAGTAAASKAAVLGANKNLDEFHTAALYLGAAAGTQVTATAAEINKLASTSANVTASNLNDLTDGTDTTLHTHALASLGVPKWGVITETWDFDDFTDGEGTSGTRVMTGQIPAGAIFEYSKVLVTAGFAGDTTAVLTIGDGVDGDRYNTGTPDVFTTAADGIEMGAPSGTRYHPTAQAVTLTVTSGTDFTAVNAGSITVSLYYLQTV